MADPAQSNRVQRSETHETTDDATTSPANRTTPADRTTPDAPLGGGAPGTSPRTISPPSNFERGAADRDIELTKEPPDLTPRDPYPGQIGGGPGAGDASSGGGAGAGIPGGGTDMRTGGAFSGGDVEQDRRRIFGDTAIRADRGTGEPKGDLEGAKVESDEGDFGGPLKIRTTDDNRAPNPKRQDQA
jgi:hypothetical protein